MTKIIINADDFGLSEVVNREIKSALKNDWISSTTILANTQLMEEVVRVYNDFPDKSFGVHLNVTEGPSLTKSSVLKRVGMIDEQGNFIKKNNFYMRVYDVEVKNAIEMEWDAQVNEILNKGISISHLDGHHHCHTWHGFEEPLIKVMRRYGINKVRRSFRDPFEPLLNQIADGISTVFLKLGKDYSNDVKMNRLRRSLRSHQDRLNNEIIMKNSGMVHTDYFCTAETFLTHLNSISHISDKSFELMCHPGHPAYQEEYAMLKNLRLTESRAILINYNEL